MTSQGTAGGGFQRAINRGHVLAAEMAAREMGGLSLMEALALCELLARTDPQRYERAALRWLERFIEERSPPLAEVALAASALAELRHDQRNTGIETLKRLLRSGLTVERPAALFRLASRRDGQSEIAVARSRFRSVPCGEIQTPVFGKNAMA
jgi:nucleotidyltransferase/DNA polymerase involved in DNA repair